MPKLKSQYREYLIQLFAFLALATVFTLAYIEIAQINNWSFSQPAPDPEDVEQEAKENLQVSLSRETRAG